MVSEVMIMEEEEIVIDGVQVIPNHEIQRMIVQAKRDKIFLDEMARAEVF